MMINIFVIILGIFATIIMDVWQVFLLLAFKIPAPEWKFVGRWILGIPTLGFVQKIPTELPMRRLEKLTGWVTHYLMGILYAFIYIYLVEVMPIDQLMVTFLFVAISLLTPWLLLFPCMGMGFFAARTPKPRLVIIYNLITHLIFSFSMYLLNNFK